MNIEQGSRSVSVLGANMHTVDVGEGAPLVFVHGMPTSSFLWRHITHDLSKNYRCIAPDLIGMGQSDHPDIDYRVFDHIRYFEAFMDALGLEKVTLVMHGWGSVIGFAYAMAHPERIEGLVFYEAHVRANVNQAMLSLPVQQLASLLAHDHASYTAIVERDYLVEKLLPAGAINPLPDAVMAHYRAPFETQESRKLLWQYVHDLPLGDGPEDVIALIEKYSSWLQETNIPKLMLYSWPGFVTTMDTVQWACEHIKNVELVEVGEAMHFAQETIPAAFSAALSDWLP
jgi:haloalkane dehalogenase